MKRNEMVEILERTINDLLYQDYKLDTGEISLILRALENAGMLPPKTYDYEIVFGNGEKTVFYKNEWEQE